MKILIASILILPLALVIGAGPVEVRSGPHDLAALIATGRPATEEEVCITCHVPRQSVVITPLWDPDAPPPSPKAFNATARDAKPTQPTGVSKMCLSCHDGVIAAGNIVSRDQQIETADPASHSPPGHFNSTTDLTDDHPISFRVKQPSASETKLDRNGEMQCTSCHDPHNDTNGKFLVMADNTGQLCSSCHKVGPTTVSHHMNCYACHQNHTSPSGDRLLKKTTISATCLRCHSGSSDTPHGPNVESDLHKLVVHDTNPPIDLKTHAPADSACTDCHDPHTMRTAPTRAPAIRANFGQIAGVRADGTSANAAQFEYEVCFKCHGDKQDVQPRITRQYRQKNMRLMFSTAAVSFHPVEGRGVNASVPSLRPPHTTGSVVYCTSCHTSDTGKHAGGMGASGPHGSDNDGLLALRYETHDYTPESAENYALCYQCHQRNVILSDRSFRLHSIHIVKSNTPCSACHDSHGIASAQGTQSHNSNLINFDLRIVQKSSTGRIEFNSTGLRTGNCTMTCHGVNHVNLSY